MSASQHQAQPTVDLSRTDRPIRTPCLLLGGPMNRKTIWPPVGAHVFETWIWENHHVYDLDQTRGVGKYRRL